MEGLAYKSATWAKDDLRLSLVLAQSASTELVEATEDPELVGLRSTASHLSLAIQCLLSAMSACQLNRILSHGPLSAYLSPRLVLTK